MYNNSNMLNLDMYQETGKNHFICEDYILKSDDYIIICDGCSSSKNTDIGARLLAISAKKVIDYYNETINNDYVKFGNQTLILAKLACLNLGLNVDCLDATLIVMRIIDDTIKVLMYGDGIIFEKNQAGLLIKEIAFDNNMPFCLSSSLYDK